MGEKEKRDRHSEGLSLGLQTTVLFQSRSSEKGWVCLIGVHEPEGQQFIP